MALVRTPHGGPNDKTAGTSWAPTIVNNAVPVGSLLVVAIACDNAATGGASPIVGVSDARGNSWTQIFEGTRSPGGAANDGVTLAVWASKITTQIEIGDAITWDFGSTSVTAKAYRPFSWTSDSGAGWQAAVGAANGQGGGNSTTPSITTASIASGNAVLAFLAHEGSTAATGDSDTTNGSWETRVSTGTGGGAGTTNVRIEAQSKVVTATGTQSYDPTLGASEEWLIGYVEIAEVLSTTVTPSAIAVTTTMTAANAAGGAAASVLAAVASALSAGIGVSQLGSTILASTTLPTSGVAVTAVADLISALAAMPNAAGAVSAAASVVTALATLSAADATGESGTGATVTPATIALAFTLDGATASVGSTPSTLNTTAGVLATGVGVSQLGAPIAASVALHGPTPHVGAMAQVIDAVAALLTPALSVDASPESIALAAAVLTAAAVSDATVTPDPLGVTITFPLATASASNVTVTPGVIEIGGFVLTIVVDD